VPLDKDEGIVKPHFTEAVRERRLSSPEKGLRTKSSGRFTLHPYSVDRFFLIAPPTIDTA
jgi:hypothetical protein